MLIHKAPCYAGGFKYKGEKVKKSNLTRKYQTNTKKEIEGKWFQLDDEIEFLIARNGGANKLRTQEAMMKYYLPHLERIKSKDITEEEALKLNTTAFVHGCVLDWKGVTLDGERAEYNPTDLIEMLIDMPEVLDKLTFFAANRDNYKDELGKS